MGLVTSGRYYDHAIYVISQFAPRILEDLRNSDSSNGDSDKLLPKDDNIIDADIIDDT